MSIFTPQSFEETMLSENACTTEVTLFNSATIEQNSEKETGCTSSHRTSYFYQTYNIPERFDHPDWFKGYGKKEHPLFKTTSAEYGSRPPSVHTMPVCFYPKNNKFSDILSKCGMYRNCSLNTYK
ncbi:piercer of microtubule wall 1 protein isoform X2 [Tachypleus tridentatus]|uniref:piercer of microtubule wall 1 protein isoform X2 n=2 Tax=Tachypleus tridentatus TaxID=6853 RepID=UPI003FD19DA3